ARPLRSALLSAGVGAFPNRSSRQRPSARAFRRDGGGEALYARDAMRDPDVIVVGSGPNGVGAATKLAERGLSVLALEAHPRRPGGALGSEELTLPGFVHDVGAAFLPLARVSRAFRELPVEEHGVRWLNAPIETTHPAPDGSSACIA